MENKIYKLFMANGSIFISKSITQLETFSNIVNNQTNLILTNLNSQRVSLARQLKQRLSVNPTDDTLRSRAVDLAWKYEQAEVALGSKGSRDWSIEQLNELMQTGKISGTEGHHIFDVSSNYGKQVNPDNIKFAKTPEEHLLVFHKGDYDNPTTGKYIDRNQRVISAANQTIFLNEILGLLNSIGIGFLFGSLASLVNHLIDNKGKQINLKLLLESGKFGGLVAGISHVSIRIIGEEISVVFKTILSALGISTIRSSIGASYLTSSAVVTVIYTSLLYFNNRRIMSKEAALGKVREDLESSAKFNLVSLIALLITGSYWLGMFIAVLAFFIFELTVNNLILEKEIKTA